VKKLLLIVNPYAGMRRVNRNLSDIVAVFNRANYEVIIYMTAGQGDGTRIAEAKARDVSLVVCAGGDGTFNEVLTGVLRSGCRTPMGYIPCGSTNDFGASLGLSANVVQAAKDIVNGREARYDVGKFGDRYFSYVASFGAFTRASYSTPQNVKNALGHTAYLLEGIQELSQLRAEHVRIELKDRVIEDDFLFGAVSNSTSVGGVLSLDPRQVDLGDGLFELLLVRAPRDLTELSECVRALRSQRYNCGMITFLSTDKLRIFTDKEMPWSLDGEREEGRTEIFVENLRHAMRMIVRKT